MDIKKISKEELKKLIDTKADFLLLDVLPPEYYAEKHIAGAQNAPVYEVVFLEYVEKLTADKDKHLVVYSENANSLAAQDAADKLIAAGYTKVEILTDGLTLWQEAGFPIEKGAALEKPEIADGKYGLDVESSIVGWTGRNPKYAHHGKITAKSGSLEFQNKRLVAGKIVLDMTTIRDEDLADEILRSVLEAHLKSSDFFDVKKYGEASFEITEAEPISDALGGTPNYELKGNLSIKDVTRQIEFPAIIAPTGNGIINGQAHLEFDRTLWNVRYGSEKFFEKLGMHLVNDIVSLELFLVAKSK